MVIAAQWHIAEKSVHTPCSVVFLRKYTKNSAKKCNQFECSTKMQPPLTLAVQPKWLRGGRMVAQCNHLGCVYFPQCCLSLYISEILSYIFTLLNNVLRKRTGRTLAAVLSRQLSILLSMVVTHLGFTFFVVNCLDV